MEGTSNGGRSRRRGGLVQVKMTVRKKSLIFFSLLISGLFFVSAEGGNWILAAEPFSFSGRSMDGSSVEAIQKTIPSLILEQIAENLTRMPRSLEKLDRTLYGLKNERGSLFLQLSAEVQKRDSLVLGKYSSGQLKAKLKDSDKKIKEIRDKIAENLKSAADEETKRAQEILRDDERSRHIEEGKLVEDDSSSTNFFRRFIKDFAPGGTYEAPVIENIVLYKNDPNQLFSAPENVASLDRKSFEFSSACSQEGIRGLVSGTITAYGSYMSVGVTIYQYPGGRIIGNATDVGSMDELRTLCARLSGQITPKISDSMPIELKLNVSPSEALESLVVTVDDVVYSDKPESLVVSSGVHFIQFSSKGYDTESTSFNFEGNREFLISVDMKKKSTGSLKIAFTKPVEGDLFALGEFRGKIDGKNRFSSISVNNRPVLGHFVSKNGFPSDFIVDRALLEEDAVLSVKPTDFDKGKYIDNRRIWMYRAYSSLIISLMPTFYVLGNYKNGSTGYAFLSGTDEKAFLTASRYVTAGISIGCGAWFMVELVRYLMAANETLPVEAKKIDPKKKTLIENEESAAKIKSASGKTPSDEKNAEEAILPDEKGESLSHTEENEKSNTEF